jgi:hypothetical protein
MLKNFALTLMSRARFDARYLSSSYLQDLLSMTQQPLVCHALLAIEASRLHSDTAHTVRLLWTGDQPNAQTSTWQHKHSKETDLHALGGIRTRNPSKRADAELRLRRRGLWGQLFIRYYWVFMIKIIYKPMNSILDRHFFTIHCTAIRQLLAPRIASLSLVSTEQNGKQACRKCGSATFTAVMPRGGLATAVDIGLHCFELWNWISLPSNRTRGRGTYKIGHRTRNQGLLILTADLWR